MYIRGFSPVIQVKNLILYYSFPSEANLIMIYSQMLEQHLTNPVHKFNTLLMKIAEPLMTAVLYCHGKVSTTFLPTALKFHYVFNLRDLSNIFQVRITQKLSKQA